ncbi:MAG: NAD-dependent epimerase/dehydratase family protein, partial [Candidatus Staskawiczbacteria bacterium]
MNFHIKKIKESATPIFIVFDIISAVLSVWISFLLRFDGQVPPDRMENFYAFTFLAAFLTIFVFVLYGLYKISWKYVSITDLPHLFAAVLISVFAIGSALFVLRDSVYFQGFPRSIIFLYAILLFLFVNFLRFSKRIYWQLFKSGSLPFYGENFPLPLTEKILNDKEIRNILITGGAGYIGSVLARQLLEAGYNVKVFDKLLFGEEPIKELRTNLHFKLIKGDIFDKDTLVGALSDVDAVVNLAAIVGEAACLSQKDVALQTNYLGAIYVARLCKTLGIKRFIQASTCSTYGQNEENSIAKEGSNLFPVDFYGETKIYAERELMRLIDNNFNPTILRFSTVYGLSPRMRFDLVVNTLTKKAVKEKEMTIFGGNQWRPLIHVSDVSRAIVLVLKAPLSKVGNQIFNVGNNDENYMISEISEIVKACVPEVKIKTIKDVEDRRNYRVDFTKIAQV